jgi:glutarate dioxygenase
MIETNRVTQGNSVKRAEKIVLKKREIKEFIASTSDISIQEIEFSPLLRYRLSESYVAVWGEKNKNSIHSAITTYEKGAVLLDYSDSFGEIETDNIMKLLTAIVYTFGNCNHDHVSGKYYYKFTISGEKVFTTPLNNPFKDMHIHTDGCFSHGFCDFVLLAKFEEMEIDGGGSKLVHIQDIENLPSLLSNSLAWRKYLYKGRSAHKLTEGIYRDLFWLEDGRLKISFNMATCVPRDATEAKFLNEIHTQLDASSCLKTLLPGQCLILNNTVWLHGRSKFSEISTASSRTMVRMRGSFQDRFYEQESEVFSLSID